MKKSLLLFSMIAALCVTGCSGVSTSENSQGTNEPSESSNVDPVNPSSSNNDESSNSASSSSQPAAPKEEVKNDNFTLLKPNNLSSMSNNCKQYVDDMRTQQRKLIQEKGTQADYYLNDLYGTAGVDLTKGVLPSSGNYQDNTGGYRDGTTENNYLDPS